VPETILLGGDASMSGVELLMHNCIVKLDVMLADLEKRLAYYEHTR
jgi:hypothetical protein